MIGRPAFVEAVRKNGLFLDTLQFQESVRVEASTELNAVRGAEMVLFCVKTTDNATTARELVPLLAPGAIVLCMQNGVDNVEQIRAAAAIEALPAVVYVAGAGALKIATQMAEALSSTGQDLNRGKRTEIDSLNGYISRRGAELGVPTPVNHALYALVKLAEGRS